jgi:hypothetical protein
MALLMDESMVMTTACLTTRSLGKKKEYLMGKKLEKWMDCIVAGLKVFQLG